MTIGAWMLRTLTPAIASECCVPQPVEPAKVAVPVPTHDQITCHVQGSARSLRPLRFVDRAGGLAHVATCTALSRQLPQRLVLPELSRALRPCMALYCEPCRVDDHALLGRLSAAERGIQGFVDECT